MRPLAKFDDRENTYLRPEIGDISKSQTYRYEFNKGIWKVDVVQWSGFSMSYARGFICNGGDGCSNGAATVTGLTPGSVYAYQIYQYAKLYGGRNGLTVNGVVQSDTISAASK